MSDIKPVCTVCKRNLEANELVHVTENKRGGYDFKHSGQAEVYCQYIGEGVKTPESHPDHWVVGHFFSGSSPNTFYYCDSYDKAWGFWMTNVYDLSDRRNVSERAIGGTFHEIYPDSAKGKQLLAAWNK